MFRRTIWLCVFGIAQLPLKLFSEPLPLKVHAESAILINADTGAVLYEKNARTLRYPASITKIATAAYALKVAGDKLDAEVTADNDAVATIAEEVLRRSNYTVPVYWLLPGSSHIGIKKGEVLSLRDLLYGMMVASGNDAANVIAQHIGGTIPEFMTAVNQYLKEIGCQQTTFYNPHGLHHPKHQTTAYDMAIMTREAMKNPIFREIVSTVSYTRPKTNKQGPTTLIQTNRLLRNGKYHYPKAIGVKTGYLSLASNTLVAAAKQGDRTLIAVQLKAKEREDIFKDAVKMFETAFNQSKVKRTFLQAGPQKFSLDVKGAKKAVCTYIRDPVSLEYYPAEEPKVKCLLAWHSLTPPIEKDQVVGELLMQQDEGTVIQKIPVLASETVPATWIWSFKKAFKESFFLKWGSLLLLSITLVSLLYKLKTR